MAIMARDSIEVDKLLKLKPQPTDLFYPTLPTYEEEFEGETEDEARNREQRNERRRVDFENECKIIEEMKHAILKQSINSFGSNKPTGNSNQSESLTQNERNDVKHAKENTHTKDNAFCHSKSKSKSLLSLC